jgi:hypothetical protein
MLRGMKIRPAPLASVILAMVACLLSGCVTSKRYRLAKPNTAPPVELNLVAPAQPEIAADLTLRSVIVYKGPGSWKREAKWDEYVFQFTNRGTEPVALTAAELTDLRGATQLPGIDPWELEKLSRTNWDRYGKTGLTLVAGAGGVALYGAAVVGSTLGSLMGGAAATGATTALGIVPIFAVMEITAVQIANRQNKRKVQEEFERRRVALPITVAPGETVSGSLFFPMTPGPQKFALRGRSGASEVDLQVGLAPLAALHLDTKKSTKTAQR